jgi:hypothetical protein
VGKPNPIAKEIRMEEAKVRERAEAHAAANVAGDLGRAAQDLTTEARANIGPVARRLPRPITDGEVTRVQAIGDGRFVVHIEFSGPDVTVTVESIWIEQDGRPMISETRIV